MQKTDEFYSRIILIIVMSIFIIYFICSSALNCVLSYDIKNMLSGRLTYIEYASLQPENLFCSSEFSFTRDGEKWSAFGFSDFISDIEVIECKVGQCG